MLTTMILDDNWNIIPHGVSQMLVCEVSYQLSTCIKEEFDVNFRCSP